MPNPVKWCTHCQKDTHDTAKCWSTHAAPAQPFNYPPPVRGLAPEWLPSAILAAVRAAPRPPPQDLRYDPELS